MVEKKENKEEGAVEAPIIDDFDKILDHVGGWGRYQMLLLLFRDGPHTFYKTDI